MQLPLKIWLAFKFLLGGNRTHYIILCGRLRFKCICHINTCEWYNLTYFKRLSIWITYAIDITLHSDEKILLSVPVSRVLKFPTIILDLSIIPFSSVSFCFMYFKVWFWLHTHLELLRFLAGLILLPLRNMPPVPSNFIDLKYTFSDADTDTPVF